MRRIMRSSWVDLKSRDGSCLMVGKGWAGIASVERRRIDEEGFVVRHIATSTRERPFPVKAQLAPLYPLGIFVGVWYNTIGVLIERLKQVSLENE
ncbi:MAG: hypothetical protein AMXMBFR82_05520 [Candidatus Hydrogenedentota bacterium]